MTCPARRIALLAVMLLASAAAGAAERYIAHELVVGKHPLYPNALNDGGAVVGHTHGERQTFAPAKAFHLQMPHSYAAYAPFGSYWATGMAVNASGAVAGFYDDGIAQHTHAYLRASDGTLTDLFASEPGAYTAAYGLNRGGTVVGSYRNEQLATSQPFAWAAGKVRLMAVPDGDDSGVATAVNDAGVIVGTSSTPNRGTRPLRWLPGSDQPQELPGLQGDLETYWSTPHAINAEGTVVGTCSLANYSYHACAWPADGGAAQDLGALPGDQPSYAFAISRAGVVVGQATAEDGSSHAVLFARGQIIDLESLTTVPDGVHLTSAVAINNHGWILVHGESDSGDFARHFLLKPKWEPKP